MRAGCGTTSSTCSLDDSCSHGGHLGLLHPAPPFATVKGMWLGTPPWEGHGPQKRGGRPGSALGAPQQRVVKVPGSREAWAKQQPCLTAWGQLEVCLPARLLWGSTQAKDMEGA